MNPLLRTLWSKRQDLQWKTLEGEAIVVDDAEGKIFRITESGCRIWALIDGSHTGEQIAGVIANEYEISSKKAVDDVTQFIKLLRKQDLITDGA